jgi:hypothetical protein
MHPTLEFDYDRHPRLADNIWHAQMAGHPKVLTYSGSRIELRKATRRQAMHFEDAGSIYEIPRILSRDEYPFACTLEGGRASWVGHIEARENSAQGGLIAAFIFHHPLVAASGPAARFLVRVINHPRGRVTAACRPPCAPLCKAGRCVLGDPAGEAQ